MSKRDLFWKGLPWKDSEFVDWPRDPEQRAALAARVVGATLVGALEHVLDAALSKLEGTPPEPGSHDYLKEAAVARILSTLSAEQRAALASLLRETVYDAAYWPLAKLTNLPSMNVDFNLVPIERGEVLLESTTLNETFGLHTHFQSWIEEFADSLADPDAA